MKSNLEQYLKENYRKGEYDHFIRTSIDSMGNISFYIHPKSIHGEELDFIVRGNKLEQLFVGD
jgi:hypothetical protein